MIIPIFTIGDMAGAIAFYTGVLDFRLALVSTEDDPFYAVLTRGADELHLSLSSGHRAPGTSTATVVCDDVDGVFAGFLRRGLAVPTRPDSPVHAGPLDQTWGTREVYIDDADGNTLCFQQR